MVRTLTVDNHENEYKKKGARIPISLVSLNIRQTRQR